MLSLLRPQREVQATLLMLSTRKMPKARYPKAALVLLRPLPHRQRQYGSSYSGALKRLVHPK